MADPQTANIGAYQPALGGDVGTWYLPLNANFGAQDSLAANVSVIALTNAPVTLTTPPNAGSAWAGPYQSQSAILRFTGTLSADVTVTIPRAGYFIVQNKCVVGAYVVVLASASPGNVICCPPGEAVHVICDGTNVDYVDLGRINEYLDLAAYYVPRWITACSILPYLNCDGSTFSGTTYPNTASYLGGTTLPDLRGRSRAALNQGTGRIGGVSGLDGNTLLSAGGEQTHTLNIAEMPWHNHGISDPGHTHYVPQGAPGGSGLGGPGPSNNLGGQTTGASATGITINNTGGGGAHNNMQPTTIAGLTLIRAG